MNYPWKEHYVCVYPDLMFNIQRSNIWERKQPEVLAYLNHVSRVVSNRLRCSVDSLIIL
jgi:hypothetical protein